MTGSTLGWIGLGRMGDAMVARLLKAGHAVAVWNRTRDKADHVQALGARVVDDKAELSACRTVFTMVSTTEVLHEVLLGPGGLASGPALPAIVVDCSSISDTGSARIRAELAQRGVEFLAAPVSGNAKVAKAGKLSVVASGQRATFDAVKPYLEALGRSTTYIGEGELARIWKIAHNTMFGVVIQNLCEITVLAEKAGIPRHVFLESINNSVLGSMYTRYKTPVLTHLSFDQVTFTPQLLLKDMDLGLGAARQLGVSMPAAAATRESVARMVGRGHGNVDFAVLLTEIAADAGLVLEPEDVPVGDGLEGT